MMCYPRLAAPLIELFTDMTYGLARQYAAPGVAHFAAQHFRQSPRSVEHGIEGGDIVTFAGGNHEQRESGGV